MVQPLAYGTLKHIAINDVTAQDNLEDLKYLFRNEIGSPRNTYRIRTMDDLIDCLERQDYLSEFNIEPLIEISDEYGGTLAEVITSYNIPKDLLPRDPYNEYREMRLAHDCATRLNINSFTIVNSGNCSIPSGNNTDNQQPELAQVLTKEKRAAIYKLIANDIGTGWRCFGRELELRQGTMDDIEIQYRDLNTRVYKLFQAFEEDSIYPNKHLLIICRALDECRRKDLRRKVERIMSP